VGLKTYIPFGPFLVAGAVLTLVRDEHLLGAAASGAGWLLHGLGWA
jgi:prepilin signal peptidase PulO-like enzyme (type II secretory pathway)